MKKRTRSIVSVLLLTLCSTVFAQTRNSDQGPAPIAGVTLESLTLGSENEGVTASAIGTGSMIPILYAPSEDDDPTLRAAISTITGAAVDYFDPRSATPTLAELSAYGCVMTWANYGYLDRTAFGDNLADFVDGGGSVVMGAFTAYAIGNSLGGRVMTPGYSPVTGGSNHFSSSSYAGDGTTLIHDGVVSYTSLFRDFLTLQVPGVQDGSFLDGEIATAYRPDFRVIYANGAGGFQLGTGANDPDWPLLIANACALANGGAAPTTTTVDPAAGQYSDVVTLTATIAPATDGSVEFFVDMVSVGTEPVIAGVAMHSYTITQSQGPYDIDADFTSTDAGFADSSGSSTLTVSREDAVVTPSGSNPSAVQVAAPGGTAASITFVADISEVADGSLGDISNAVPVTITLNAVTGPSPAPCMASIVGGGIGGTLTATCVFTSVPVNVYDVTFSVGGNYYTGSASSVLTVFDPSLGFTTGGGKVLHEGVLSNFGFNVKYLKKGAQGSLLYVEHRPAGDVRVKSNVMATLAIVRNTAIFTGKCTVNGVGNYGFRATVVDNGSPGSSDQFGLQVTDPGGAIVVDLTYTPLTIDGGNIVVPHTKGK